MERPTVLLLLSVHTPGFSTNTSWLALFVKGGKFPTALLCRSVTYNPKGNAFSCLCLERVERGRS